MMKEGQDSYHFLSIFPFDIYFPGDENKWQVIARCKLLLFTLLAIHGERTDGRKGWRNVRRQLIHESRLLSYFH